MKELIKKLTETYGPSGEESQIREVIIGEIKDHADEIRVDVLGNIIARKAGSGEKMMLAAHMDEIGLIITNIDDKGFLRFSNIGGVSPFTLIGERVIFENGTVGVLGMEKPANLFKNEMKDLKFNNMFIDIGARSKEEALKKVRLGDKAVYYRNCDILGDCATAKALDDRAGCAVLIRVLQNLKSPRFDTYFVFTVQEEVGVRGAKTSAFGIDPDLAIAVDVTMTGDTPESEKMAVELGKGPAVKVMDRSVISHPRIKEMLIEAAEKNKIPYQLEVLEMGGTDAGAIHLSRSGVPSGGLSIPTRYVHTPSEMASIDDIEKAANLLLCVLEK
ncbi:M42 family metallopeptidase [Thermosediminibacter litoriperuensis]|uniref:Endoglucanase n=1 Tax=Thermosediminibacter litoriperuensis TaxID=291989 RepID=A0A5S5AYS2_9FIRM|nr:M42 family metallopeptidase [Thermosediminibacter litoriperuensis]TYP59861.1 endoglucanase [Thermosediminibacter litoriperuensis]